MVIRAIGQNKAFSNKDRDAFIKYLIEQGKASLTIKNYCNDVAHFIKWFIEKHASNFVLHRLTPTDIRLYQTDLSKQFSVATTNRKIIALGRYLHWNWTKSKGKYVFLLPELFPQPIVPLKCLTEDEQTLLQQKLTTYHNKRDAAITEILLNTGIRVGELCQLRWLNIKMESKYIIVQSVSKKNKTRHIPINDTVCKALIAIGYTKNKDSNNHVFIGQRGPLSARGIQIICRAVSEETKINITPNILRNSFCRNLAKENKDLQEVAAIVGHESLDLTRKYYDKNLHNLTVN